MGARSLAANSLRGTTAQRWQAAPAAGPPRACMPCVLQLSCAALPHLTLCTLMVCICRTCLRRSARAPQHTAPHCCPSDLAMRRAREATQQAERNARNASWKEARESGALFRTTYGKSEDAMVRDLPTRALALGKACAHVLLTATRRYRYNLAGPGEESRQTHACSGEMRQCDQTRQQPRKQRSPPQPMNLPGLHATKSSALHMLGALGTSSMCPQKRRASGSCLRWIRWMTLLKLAMP